MGTCHLFPNCGVFAFDPDCPEGTHQTAPGFPCWGLFFERVDKLTYAPDPYSYGAKFRFLSNKANRRLCLV
jgi:hypothetical protein